MSPSNCQNQPHSPRHPKRQPLPRTINPNDVIICELTPDELVLKVPSQSCPGHARTVRFFSDGRVTQCSCPSTKPCYHITELEQWRRSLTGLYEIKRVLEEQRKLVLKQDWLDEETLHWLDTEEYALENAIDAMEQPQTTELDAWGAAFEASLDQMRREVEERERRIRDLSSDEQWERDGDPFGAPHPLAVSLALESGVYLQ